MGFLVLYCFAKISVFLVKGISWNEFTADFYKVSSWFWLSFHLDLEGFQVVILAKRLLDHFVIALGLLLG